MMEKKSYDIKLFGGIEFEDYWNLREHPLYVLVNKKHKPYIQFLEEPADGFEKVTSLHSIALYLRSNGWTFESKYWQHISIRLKGALYFPYTEL
ncbi:hypothetical protein E0W68_02260 [Flavobacterium salilacus subsp. salilacus]|uniref:hypothetical protein n=1 Tax=Flavobacterium TaxID=237 RepID=UPI001074ED9C|nr:MULTISPECIES: hypothetical protein [Flavobacterium]KAF2520066.1 hypothetical protein E0W68_02260 [Flavobacterium salilacus subsp. salilacus]MBE1614018.1 hypothetical protein [Flavobacterium sp. SaA2.13]